MFYLYQVILLIHAQIQDVSVDILARVKILQVMNIICAIIINIPQNVHYSVVYQEHIVIQNLYVWNVIINAEHARIKIIQIALHVIVLLFIHNGNIIINLPLKGRVFLNFFLLIKLKQMK